MDGSTPLVEMENVERHYRMGPDTVRALDGVSFRIPAGEFVAIMGPSGSGKSTAMNLLGLLDTPTGGRLLLSGRDVARARGAELAALRNRTIGFVFQNYNLLPRTSALDNVCLPLLYARVPRRERIERARAALARVGLAERERHHPSELSGGQQQRVAIARALVNEPPLLLADEPTGNLDSRSSLEILAILQAMNRAGVTVVLVTHEDDIARHARRVLRFRDGRIVSDLAVAAPLDARSGLAASGGEGGGAG